MYNSFTFGTTLKEVRTERRLSQKQLAEDICSQALLSRIERNIVIPSVILMSQLCERLEVSLDYILDTDYEETAYEQEPNDWLELMKYYHQSLKYSDLKRLLEETALFDSLSSKQEQQEYLFYAGCCSYYHTPHSPQTITIFEEALHLTYPNSADYTTDMEIMLLSELGKVYANFGKTTTGMSFMQESLTLFYNYQGQRKNNQLAKVFYNIATIYIDLRNYKEALNVINQGINWSSRQKNYFYLDELFLLKGIVSQDYGLIDEAVKFVQMAELLKELSFNNQLAQEKNLRKTKE